MTPPVEQHRPITGKIVIATHNAGKLREMRELLALYGVEAVSAGELDLPEPDETGTTFAENAAIKAQAAANAAGLPAFADDSGLVVDVLGGSPGIHSARWAGTDKNFARAMQAIDSMLRDHGATTPALPQRAFRLGALRRLAGRAYWRTSRRSSKARWSGRRAAKPASATIRCFCRTVMTAPSAR